MIVGAVFITTTTHARAADDVRIIRQHIRTCCAITCALCAAFADNIHNTGRARFPQSLTPRLLRQTHCTQYTCSHLPCPHMCARNECVHVQHERVRQHVTKEKLAQPPLSIAFPAVSSNSKQSAAGIRLAVASVRWPLCGGPILN